MRILIRKSLHRIAAYLELIVALIITVMIMISIANMIIHIGKNPLEIQDAEGFFQFMNDALSLIVGIEFLKMIIIPTSDNIIETLTFAVSRHIILEHGLDVMIIGTICILILFVIKKYLFSPFEESESLKFRASLPINTVNVVFDTDIVADHEDETIREFMTNKLRKEDKPVVSGSSIMVEDLKFTVIRTGKKGIKRVTITKNEE